MLAQILTIILHWAARKKLSLGIQMSVPKKMTTDCAWYKALQVEGEEWRDSSILPKRGKRRLVLDGPKA